MQVTGIILAGGKSSRMGSDKGLVEYAGIPLVQYSINACREITGEIMISANNPEYGRFGFPVVSDNFPGIGPIGGLEAALSVSKTGINMVLPCDMPGVSAELLNLLLRYGEAGKTLVIRDMGGKVYPVLGLYPSSALPVIREQIKLGDYRMTSLLAKLDAGTLTAASGTKLDNINIPGDLI